MREKREVLARFYDQKGFLFELVNEKQRRLFDKKDNYVEEIKLYQGKELVNPWEVHKRKLDLSRSTGEEAILLIDHYLKSSVMIKNCLQELQFPFEALLSIWQGVYRENQIIKETLLKYQDVLKEEDFMNSLIQEEKWVVFTQNVHRTHENMNTYGEMFEEMVANFLHHYLSEKNIKSNELLYGEWRSLIDQAIQSYYSEELRNRVMEQAVNRTEVELASKKEEVLSVANEIRLMDTAYEQATISEKLKMETDMKDLLKKEGEVKIELKDVEEKKSRIESYFTKVYLPLSETD